MHTCQVGIRTKDLRVRTSHLRLHTCQFRLPTCHFRLAANGFRVFTSRLRPLSDESLLPMQHWPLPGGLSNTSCRHCKPNRMFLSLKWTVPVLLSALLAGNADAQPGLAAQRKVDTARGAVQDLQGKALPFASITLANGTGVQADSNGLFRVPRLSRPAVLRVSYAGFRTVEVTAADTPLTIRMEPVPELKEVVVTGPVCRRISCGGCFVRALRAYARRPAAVVVVGTRVYPNPTRGDLHLQGTADLQSLLLVDMSGRLLRQWGRPAGDPGTISLSGIPPGSYLLRLQFARGRQQTEKIVIVP
ncbi:MAG: T9SS type A sorting domain-containing protein [Chitinophagaceae bacterium]|nr:MAG: T9SS type A sorting domain-containing protein [Chitinophagaceae bacterium]